MRDMAGDAGFPPSRGALSIGLVIAFIGIVFTWGTLATKTTGAVLSTAEQAITSGSISIIGLCLVAAVRPKRCMPPASGGPEGQSRRSAGHIPSVVSGI